MVMISNSRVIDPAPSRSQIYLRRILHPSTCALNYSSQDDRGLWQAVTTVNGDISTRAVAGCVRRQVEVSSFELMGLTLTATTMVRNGSSDGSIVTYPMGILSFHMSLVSLGTKSEISVAM